MNCGFKCMINLNTSVATVAEDDHLQVFQNYRKLKKQIKTV